MLFKFFSHLQNFLKIGIDTHPIDFSCHQNLKKIHRLQAKILAHEVGKYENMKKSRSTRSHFTHARSCSRALDSARSIKLLRVRNDRLPSGRILCDKEIFFPYDGFTGYKKSNQNQFGRALSFASALTCYKIYLLYSSLSDFDSFR